MSNLLIVKWKWDEKKNSNHRLEIDENTYSINLTLVNINKEVMNVNAVR